LINPPNCAKPSSPPNDRQPIFQSKRGNLGPNAKKLPNAVRRTLKLKKQFTDLGGTAFAGSPADLGMLLAAETEKWQGGEILHCQALPSRTEQWKVGIS
jgi:hypothetical protein